MQKNLHSTFYILHSDRRGQIMLLTVLTIGATILGVTTIGGLLMLFQIRQTTDLANSAKAIYAADAGIEWALFNIFQVNAQPPRTPMASVPFPAFSNGASTTVTCYRAPSTNSQPCNASTTSMKAVGRARGASRAFGVSIQ